MGRSPGRRACLCSEEPSEEPSEERVLGPMARQARSIEEVYHRCLMWSVVHHYCLVMHGSPPLPYVVRGSPTTALSCNHTPLATSMLAWPTAA